MSQKKDIVIAKIHDNSYTFTIDTIAFKKYIFERLPNAEGKEFFKIEIRHQLTLGSRRQFYFILLVNKARNIKIARWLIKDGNNLLIRDDPEAEDPFEQIYLTCEGGGDCSPNVFEDKGMRMWGCSQIVGCTAKEGEEPKCITSQSIF